MGTSYSIKQFNESFGALGAVDGFKAKLAENKLSTESLFKEFFTNDNVRDMVPPAFMSQILMGAFHNPIARKVANVIPMSWGDQITIRRVNTLEGAQVIKEGASADIQGLDFTKESYEYHKIAMRPSWTYETLQDYPLDLISLTNQFFGAAITAQEDEFFMTELFDKTGAGSGCEILPAVPGVFDTNDLIETIADVQGVKRFYKADTLLMNLANYKQLLKDKDLRNAMFMGNSIINDEGQLTNFLGCTIYVAEMFKGGPKDTVVPIKDIYAFDSQYATALIERQGLTIENWNLPERQIANAMITERVVPVVLQPEAIRRLKLS